MEQKPAPEYKEDKCEGFKTKLGLIMIAIYTVVYFTFIIIAVANPQLMAKDVGGLNLAIAYGFGIIILAIIQALIYNFACSRSEKNNGDTQTSEGDTE
jgi:uncharacterized membrane protein (DUF485 family)